LADNERDGIVMLVLFLVIGLLWLPSVYGLVKLCLIIEMMLIRIGLYIPGYGGP